MRKKKFSLELTTNGKTYKSSSDSAFGALSTLPRPDKLVAKGVLTVTNGDAKRVMAMVPVRIKRLFFQSPNIQQVIAKQLFAGLVK